MRHSYGFSTRAGKALRDSGRLGFGSLTVLRLCAPSRIPVQLERGRGVHPRWASGVRSGRRPARYLVPAALGGPIPSPSHTGRSRPCERSVTRKEPSGVDFAAPGIGGHTPIWIPADEVTGRKNVENPTPPVGVHRHRGTRWNTSVENSDSSRPRTGPCGTLAQPSWRRDHRATASRDTCWRRSTDVTAFGLPSPFADTPKASFCCVSLNRTGMAAGFWRAPSLATSRRRVRARGVAGSPHEHRRAADAPALGASRMRQRGGGRRRQSPAAQPPLWPSPSQTRSV